MEVLLATVLLSSVFISTALVFPKVAKVLTNNRRHWLASNFASSRIEELKSQPYPVLAPNVSTDFPMAQAGTCNCSAVNMTQMPNNGDTVTDSGITYTRTSCINLSERVQVGAAWVWQTLCPSETVNNDKGVKNIRVQVTWTAEGETKFVNMDTLATRYAQ